jgi:predicted dienelactone hydrolase
MRACIRRDPSLGAGTRVEIESQGDRITIAANDSGAPHGVHVSGVPRFDRRAPAKIGGIANGSFDSWNFRDASGAFSPPLVAGTGTPTVERLDFRLTIPEGAVPGSGFPVVIYAHGLGGQERGV